MMYREYLVMRKAVAVYLGIMLAIAVVAVVAAKGGSNNGDYSDFIAPAAWMTAIFATIFGVALGNASRQPARVMWVVPIARWKSALQIICVDFVSIVVVYLGIFAILFLNVIIGKVIGGFVGMHGEFEWGFAFQSLCFAYAIYSWCALIGMIGRRAAYLGILALPSLMLWSAFAGSYGWLGTVLRSAISANPIAVYNAGMRLHAVALIVGVAHLRAKPHDLVVASLAWMGNAWETPLLVAIIAATCIAAVALWQRSELLTT